jgi:hypothetical protein
MATLRAELIKNTNKIRVINLTDYTAYPNARTVINITDPNGNPIHINTDFDNPDMTVGSPTSVEYDLNLVAGSIPEGIYIIDYQVDYDLDDIADDSGQDTFTYDVTDLISISIEITSSLADATIESTDTTSYDSRVTLNSRIHTLTYPATRGSTSSSDKDNNTTIALTELFTGEYDTEITSGILIEVSTSYWIYDQITGTQTHTVWSSSGIEDLESGIAELKARFEASLQTDNGTATQELETLVTRINNEWTLYKINRDAGDRDGASLYLNNIADLLSADGISINEPEDESVPVAKEYPGYATQWLNDPGVPPNTLGRNDDYYIDVTSNKYYHKVAGSWAEIGSFGGYTIIVVSGTVLVPTDSVGGNPDFTNAKSTFYIYKDGADVTSGFTFTKSGTSDADGTIAVNVLTVNSITADTGYIDIDADKAGVDTIKIRVYVKKSKAGASGASGSSYEIPYMNGAGTDFTYDPNLKWNGSQFVISDGANNQILGNSNTGSSITTASNNILIGAEVGRDLISGVSNVYIGYAVGQDNLSSANTMIGYTSGQSSTGAANAFFGYQTGLVNTGSNNVFFGYKTGLTNTGTGNVFLGHRADIAGAVSNKLVIENSVSTTPLVYGEFDNDYLKINGDLEVTGSFTGGGILTEANDGDITKISDSSTVADNYDAVYKGLAWIDSERAAFYYLDSGLSNFYLSCVQYVRSTDTWSVVGTPLLLSDEPFKYINFGHNQIAAFTYDGTSSKITVYSFNGSTWSSVGTALSINNSTNLIIWDIAKLDNSTVAVVFRDTRVTDVTTFRTYSWNGSTFSQTGNDLITSRSFNYEQITRRSDNSIFNYGYDTTNKIYKLSWDGTDWTEDSSQTLNLGNSVSIYGLDDENMLLADGSANTIYSYKYIGTQFYDMNKDYSITWNNGVAFTKMLDNQIFINALQSSGSAPINSLFKFKIS